MKVLHIISSGGMYGAEAVILNLSRGLNEGSHHSALGVFNNSSNPNLQIHEAAVRSGIESHLIPCSGRVGAETPAAIRTLVVKTNADVIHSHGYKADIYTYFALRKTSVPYVSSCHNWLQQNWMVSLYGAADRLILRKFARVVAVSEEVKQRLLQAGVGEEKVRIVRNGIDLRPFDAATPSIESDPGVLVIGWVGRLSHEKGPDILLRAAALVLVEFPSARFVVVGEGPQAQEIERLIDELGIREQLVRAGRREDMPSVYASLDILVSSSRQEGLPMAILEGMASGLPLVATAVGDVPTVVRDGVSGLLVPNENFEQLAEAILQLLRDPAQRAQLGSSARQLIADEYAAERMTTDYLQIYEEAIQAGKRSKKSELR